MAQPGNGIPNYPPHSFGYYTPLPSPEHLAGVSLSLHEKLDQVHEALLSRLLDLQGEVLKVRESLLKLHERLDKTDDVLYSIHRATRKY